VLLCGHSVQPESLLVRMGGIDFASVEDKWIESRVQPVQHPQFNIHTQANDIALLKLLTPLVTYQSSTLPICLPDKDMEFDGDQSFVSGWGRLGESKFLSFCYFISHPGWNTFLYFFLSFYRRKSNFDTVAVRRRAHHQQHGMPKDLPVDPQEN
jgi:hypothetical protein